MCRSEDGTRLGVPPHNSKNNSKEGVGFNLQLALFYQFQLKPFSIFSRKNRNLVFLPLLCYVPPVFPRASYWDIFTPPFSNYTPRLLSPMMMTIDYLLNDFHIPKSEHLSHLSLYSINPRPQWLNQSVSNSFRFLPFEEEVVDEVAKVVYHQQSTWKFSVTGQPVGWLRRGS